MSKIDEKKLIEGLTAIAEYFQIQADLSLRCHKAIVGYLTQATPIPADLKKEIPNFFPDPYNDKMQIEDKGDHYEVHQKQWLPIPDFKIVADIVKKWGGTWHPAGKNSYFTIPKGDAGK